MADTNQNGQAPAEPTTGVTIDGHVYTLKSLSFRERLELRKLIRASIGRDDAELYDVVDDADLIPNIVYLVKRRSDPTYTLDQALDMSEADLEAAAESVPTTADEPALV